MTVTKLQPETLYRIGAVACALLGVVTLVALAVLFAGPMAAPFIFTAVVSIETTIGIVMVSVGTAGVLAMLIAAAILFKKSCAAKVDSFVDRLYDDEMTDSDIKMVQSLKKDEAKPTHFDEDGLDFDLWVYELDQFIKKKFHFFIHTPQEDPSS